MSKIHIRLLAILGALMVLPFFLRRRPRAARRIIIRGQPAEIFPLLNDLRAWPRWTAWSWHEEIHYTYSGPPLGVGATQAWSGNGMDGRLQITQSEPDQRVAYSVEMGHGKHRIEGVIALEPVRAHLTQVTWLARWNSSRNPCARYTDLLFLWWMRRDLALSLANLRKAVETQNAAAFSENPPAR